MQIGNIIRLYRDVNRITVRTCAKDIGISPATLSRVERGGKVDGHTLMKFLIWLFTAVPKQ